MSLPCCTSHTISQHHEKAICIEEDVGAFLVVLVSLTREHFPIITPTPQIITMMFFLSEYFLIELAVAQLFVSYVPRACILSIHLAK